MEFWANFQAWYRKPFSVDMSARDWFLFLGLVMVILVLWRNLLAHILEGIEG